MGRPRISWKPIAAGAWLGLSLSIAAAALWLRLATPYYRFHQFVAQSLVVAECFLAVLGLVVAVPLLISTGGSRRGARTALFAVATPVIAAFVLQIAALEPRGENLRKNEAYLRRQAEIISDYARSKGRMPPSFDRALEWSGQTFPNRGDADGGPVGYIRVDDQHYRFCATGPRLHVWIDDRSIRIEPWPAGKHDPFCAGPPERAVGGSVPPPQPGAGTRGASAPPTQAGPQPAQAPAAAFSAAIAES